MSFADRSVFSRFFLDVIFVNLAGCGVGYAPVRSGPAACRRNGFGNRFRRAAANRFRSSVRYLRPGRSRYGRIPVHGGCGGRPAGKCRSRISTRAGRLRRPLPPRSCGARYKAKRRSSGRFRSHRRGRLRYRRGRNRTGPVPGKADRVRVRHPSRSAPAQRTIPDRVRSERVASDASYSRFGGPTFFEDRGRIDEDASRSSGMQVANVGEQFVQFLFQYRMVVASPGIRGDP